MALFSDASEIAKWSLITIVMMVGTLAILGAGAYVLVRITASVLNARRDGWEKAGKALNLDTDKSQPSVQKDLIGVRDGRSVRVSYYAVMRTEHSSDPYAAAEVGISPGFDHSFEITKHEMLYERVAEYLNPGADIDVLNEGFTVEASDTAALRKLLLLEVPGGESPTILTDLMHARKRFHRVRLTDRGAVIGVKATSAETDRIETAINRAAYLAQRLEAARSILAKG